MTSVRAHPRAHPRHPHDDAPDTSVAFRRIAALPDGPSKEALRQDVVRAWMPMAERLAGQFRNRGEATEDLRQVAMVGLVKAVRRYDPNRGSAFESYAVPTVVGEVKRHFRDHMWSLHVPRRAQEPRIQVRAAVQELTRAPDAPTPDVPCLRRLSERERKILYLRFFCDETRSRIAGRLGISQMQVSRLLSETCARLSRQAGSGAT
ncbi:sigma-70 family RNA polymerase sigma factor [Streptomyces rugosispiralis]|uniref:Sigma-70 family RNA polymerase sigma factor n=1 Tax=Streptomyces rugosispiralis TaxID=2967341 RepID=A0ABT1V646_9ACTN|nr:sigma-70 family RNA polymerase sigma factor [Streptomyces rugosispiralis]MCQ8192857.1 sigma-70 family RNA polymerase sigma factor [Streptomyces rugosispiralis]